MFFNTLDMSIYYEKYGNSDKTILILPGWGNTRGTFRQIIEAFKDKYTIYIFDYPGFGNSPIPNKTLDIFDYALTIKDFLEKEKIDNPIIIAHSFGGRIVALLSGYYKINFEKILLLDVAGIKPKKTIKTFLKEKIYKILKLGVKLLPKLKQEYYLQKLLKYFGSTDYNNLPPMMRDTFKNIVNKDLKYYFKNINSNVLIVWGKKDTSTPIKDAFTIKKLIKNSLLIVMPYSGHFAYLESPITMISIIDEFINNTETS